MENNLSGSVSFNFIDEIKDMINTDEFDKDIVSSFSEKFYILNKLAPNPYWAYSLNLCRMIKINREAELIPLEVFNKESNNTECFVNQNIVTVPTDYISELEWH